MARCQVGVVRARLDTVSMAVLTSQPASSHSKVHVRPISEDQEGPMEGAWAGLPH